MFFEKYVKKICALCRFWYSAHIFYGNISNFNLNPIEKLYGIYYTGNKHIFDDRREVYEKI